jgi:hypothetical protein
MLSVDPLPEGGAIRHAWICLLLAFLFLYNPYLNAQGSAGGLNVQHPASHRATVGSSELEEYSSPSDQDTHLFVAFFFAKVISLLPFTDSQSFLPQGSELPQPRQLFCASLWFRPPPTN